MKLEVFQNGQLLQEIPVSGESPQKEVWVGRDEACVIHLDDRAISRKHALFRSTVDGIEFEKKSKFGWVKVNGEELTQAILREGDRLEMGSFEIRVKGDKSAAPEPKLEPKLEIPVESKVEMKQPPPPPLVIAEPEVPVLEPVVSETPIEEVDPFASVDLASEAPAESHENPHEGSAEAAPFDFNQSAHPEGVEALNGGFHAEGAQGSEKTNFELSNVSGDGATRVINAPDRVKALLQFGNGAANVTQYEIVDSEIAIGRSQLCHVVLEDKRSSRKHALIRKQDGKFILKDLGSANGTLINQQKVDEQELESGDQIQIGDTVFEFKQVQADYDSKKQDFIAVPQQESAAEAEPVGFAPLDLSSGLAPDVGFADQMQPMSMGAAPAPDAGAFQTGEEPKKSILSKYIDRYRAMSTKQQIIYGGVILVALWFLTSEEPEKGSGKIVTGQKKTAVKKDAATPKIGTGATFEMLTPEQQSYIKTQYQLAFDNYKSREYDKSLLEVGKIFSLVQDYKNAREIESFAREGKHKAEAQEEERKRKEAEKQAQLKLQSLIEQAGSLMDKKKYKEAEALFPEIELLQPENLAVATWHKQIMAEQEKIEAEKAEKQRIEEMHRLAWSDYQKVLDRVKKKEYYEALDDLDEIEARPLQDQKLKQTLKDEMKTVEAAIANGRDPFLAQGKQLEQEGKLGEAYKAFQKAAEADVMDEEGNAGMKRIKATLDSRAKYYYAEGVFAESYSDFETAEKKYREVLEAVPPESDYYLKAQSRLKKITVFRRPATPGGDTPQ